jgi:hypothetical protein
MFVTVQDSLTIRNLYSIIIIIDLLERESSGGGPGRATRGGATLVRQGLRDGHHDEEHVQDGDSGGGGNHQVLAAVRLSHYIYQDTCYNQCCGSGSV